MKRKRNIIILITLIIILSIAFWKNSNKEKEEKTNKPTYSNLVDKKSQDLVEEYLLEAGIDKDNIESFLSDVNLYNKTIKNKSLVDKGFKIINNKEVKYDKLAMIEKWEETYPSILWHNCRLSVFRLLNNFIEVKNPIIDDDTMLFQDKEVIDLDKKLVGNNYNNFLSLFSYVSTKNTDDVNEHIKVFKENWRNKGVKFKNDKISLITVVFNTNIEELDTTSQLFIGHAGLLWEGDNGKLYFLEKLSYTEPYQLDIFKSRQELNDYLMHKYDVDRGKKTSIPFIMENDQLLEGFRPNLNKENKYQGNL
ncbi:MAG: DUF4300 family protein [Peptoniphilaceae bacterium]